MKKLNMCNVRSRAAPRRSIPNVQGLEDRTLLSTTVFKDGLSDSTGVAVDPAGNVYVCFLENAFASAVDQYAPNGTHLARFSLGNAFPGRMAYDSASARLLVLDGRGKFYAVDPALGSQSVEPLFELGMLYLDVSGIYDAQTGRTDASLAGMISTADYSTQFGDLAVYQSPQYGSELLVAMTSNNYQFVIRIRNWKTPATATAKVLAGSSTLDWGISGTGLPSGFIASTRGVAVDAQGTALTTLPVAPTSNQPGHDVLISFNIDAPAFSAPLGVGASASISSWGMTTDARGDFVITTGQQGSVYTQGLPGVVILDPQFSRPTSVTLPSVGAISDVAVGPGDSTLFLALPQTGFGDWQGDGTGQILATTYAPPQAQPDPGSRYLIYGAVFNDLDGDGEFFDRSDSGLAGWTIYDDRNFNRQYDSGESYAVSDSSGMYYLLVPLPDQYPSKKVYNIRAVQQDGRVVRFSSNSFDHSPKPLDRVHDNSPGGGGDAGKSHWA